MKYSVTSTLRYQDCGRSLSHSRHFYTPCRAERNGALGDRPPSRLPPRRSVIPIKARASVLEYINMLCANDLTSELPILLLCV
jgi:hypothetical protein